ncbi:hypothetical protein HN51_063833 [Arachis hypogaea]|uniref:uncharacterized protein LOC107638936 n=1 Tax=Arachis ipaensis TaxID=130454 RepID=UPI0007AF541A|nr:uncharacterized protein LOC107638936 [Arachis ipaensis]XP_025630156.1 uncharacterized protein LOC112723128 isoform X1 [Arachis hypogaea]QHO21433.1 uncharacterized protein DS421_11g346650 [Arachis hypogaea]
MSATGGAAISGGNRTRNRHLGDNRFYSPPPLRKHREKQHHPNHQYHHHHDPPQRSSLSRTSSENRPGSSSDCSISSRATSDISNLDRFLEYTTPLVPAQYLPKTSSKKWKPTEAELHPYFVLGDLWESFKEWSAYGAGVPLMLNGSESVTQYYNVSLSAIQLYIDPSKPSSRLRKPSQESDSESARETSSDSSSGYCHERGTNSIPNIRNHLNISDANNHGLERVSGSMPFVSSSSDETQSCNPPGQKIFEYFERETPYNRAPLADKISDLARHFPELKTYWSCDLSPASWVSLAWYPIYRIPTGPTLQSLSACFLTYHSLSTALQSPNTDGLHIHYSRGRDISSKLSLPIFGLAFHKFKVSVWDPEGVSECQKANSLMQSAENWLRRLRIEHPDYNYFITRCTYLR